MTLALASPQASSPVAPSVAPSVAPAIPTDLQQLRVKAMELAASETLDKPSALAMMALFSTMESMLQSERHARDMAEARHQTAMEVASAEIDRHVRRRSAEEAAAASMPAASVRARR